jgi:heat shock protein HspQ
VSNILNNIKKSKFNIGDLVIHKIQGYRAVIIDIDPLFQASGKFNPLALKYEFATQNLWYRLLVDKSSQKTYVKESCLAADFNPKNIQNPNINKYLIRRNGDYYIKASKH